MPRFRTHKVKHEHSIIDGLRPVLDRMAACPAVHAVIPGTIRPVRAPRQLSVTVQYPTDTGLRLLARTGSAVQEIFVVTDDPAGTRQWLEAHGLIEREGPAHEPPPEPAHPSRQVVVRLDHDCARCGRRIAAGSRAVRIGQPPAEQYVHVRCLRAPAPPDRVRPR